MKLPRFLTWFWRRRNAQADWSRESPVIERLSKQYERARKGHRPRQSIADQMFNERMRRMRLQFGRRG